MELYPIAYSRHDLSPEQFYLRAGDEIYVTHKGEPHLLVVSSVISEEDRLNEITISGTLKPL